MQSQSGVSRVVVVVLDGLRPDAIGSFRLSAMAELMAGGAWTLDAMTVSPSVTVAAITSLLLGVSPDTHGLKGDRVFIPRAAAELIALPEILASARFDSWGFVHHLPVIFRGVAARVARRLGFRRLSVDGATANDILDAATPLLAEHDRGLFVLHWPDADAAGHRSGWMSNEYGAACRQMDGALDRLINLADDGRTMFVLLADHGGGGTKYNDHESEHPADVTIPLVLWGAGILPTWLSSASILDVAPTVLAALGVNPPDCLEGRILSEALAGSSTATAEVA
jgi:predicted AlkP superfamily pyrophosphatase or phosphodiesterase